MKINLVIEANTSEELRDACRQIVEGDPRSIINSPLSVGAVQLAEPVLVTGEPDDPYGDGNGPVDVAVRLAEPDESDAASETPERDAAGLPWDERIHAGSKTLTADGNWRKRRGVDGRVVAAVETELRAKVEFDDCYAKAFDTTPSEPEPAVAPDTTPSEPVSETAAEHTYTAQDVMKIVGSAMSSGSREPTYIAELCKAANVEQIIDIFSNTEALAAIVVKLRVDGVIDDV